MCGGDDSQERSQSKSSHEDSERVLSSATELDSFDLHTYYNHRVITPAETDGGLGREGVCLPEEVGGEDDCTRTTPRVINVSGLGEDRASRRRLVWPCGDRLTYLVAAPFPLRNELVLERPDLLSRDRSGGKEVTHVNRRFPPKRTQAPCLSPTHTVAGAVGVKELKPTAVWLSNAEFGQCGAGEAGERGLSVKGGTMA